MKPELEPHREVVLIGGGHAHVQVLRRQLMDPLPNARLTLIVDRLSAAYSGMVPGLVAGQYLRSELEIDLRPLARRAGARIIEAHANRLDTASQVVELSQRPPIHYDFCSINIGATVAGRDLPGVTEHALPTRPIGRFVERLDEAVATLRSGDGPLAPSVAVVGAGAGGVELAFCLQQRLQRDGLTPSITLIESSSRPLQGVHPRVVRIVEQTAADRGIQIRTGARVSAVESDAVRLEDGTTLRADLVVWVTGASPLSLGPDSGLSLSSDGFIAIDDQLRVLGHDNIFAVGDCAKLSSWPDCPRAGVYAVRQGPVLARNLSAVLTDTKLRPYNPQRQFLALLNLGDGHAIGGRNGAAFEGRWVFRLKDRIDRRFMARFQVLDKDGAPLPAFSEGLPEMPEMDASCGGCAAKVAATPLTRALQRLRPIDDEDIVMGINPPDDAVALARPNETLVASIDAFPAFTDDPWLVGRVAALNAVSDLSAKGIRARLALAHICVPEDEDQEEVLYQVLAGVREELDAVGCTLGGGHTTVGERLSAGLAVVGFSASDDELIAKGSAAPGDRLILTGALGTGVLFHADMAGRAAGLWVAAALTHMLQSNQTAADLAKAHGVRSMTDVTGFGLAGHLCEMLSSSHLAARLTLSNIPALPGVLGLISRGERSTFHRQNETLTTSFAVALEHRGAPELALIADPQTAGPLLLSAPTGSAQPLLTALHAAGYTFARDIGEVVERARQPAVVELI